MSEEYKTYVNMEGNLVETKVTNKPSVPLNINKKITILSVVFLLLYIFFILCNFPDMELIPMLLGVILLYFAFELFPYINKNRYLILVLIYGLIGIFESFRLFLFFIGPMFGDFGIHIL